MFIECCITNVSEGITAFQKGAHRLEACSRLETEGMTPDWHWVEELCRQVQIPVRVMIRETEAGFEADDQVIHQMIKAISIFKKIPIEGFVTGVMKDGRVDKEAMTQLLHEASPCPVTFHKAIDLSMDIEEDINWLNQFPVVDTILTSGGAVLAMDGTVNIISIKNWFKRNTMAGGKVTQHNMPELHDQLQLKWYHGRNIL